MSRRRLGLAGATVLAIALPLFSSPAASAVTTSVSSLDVPAAVRDVLCAVPTSGSAARTAVPDVRSRPDTPEVSADDVADATAASRQQQRRAAATLPDVVKIPVYVTMVRGKHRGEVPPPSSTARSWIRILNDAFAAKQSAESSPTRYTFVLESVRRVRNERWYHAVGDSKADREMRRKMHRGSLDDLNLYVTSPGRAGDILGFARLPQDAARNPAQDGVTVNIESFPGGNIRYYRSGDTLVHEVGHWMGLFHTFQGWDPDNPSGRGGCAGVGDGVDDTPAERVPNFRCELDRDGRPVDTCQAPGLDPVHNFMDYSYDSCMNQFTAGQVALMDTQFARYRYSR